MIRTFGDVPNIYCWETIDKVTLHQENYGPSDIREHHVHCLSELARLIIFFQTRLIRQVLAVNSYRVTQVIAGIGRKNTAPGRDGLPSRVLVTVVTELSENVRRFLKPCVQLETFSK